MQLLMFLCEEHRTLITLLVLKNLTASDISGKPSHSAGLRVSIAAAAVTTV